MFPEDPGQVCMLFIGSINMLPYRGVRELQLELMYIYIYVFQKSVFRAD